MRFVKREWARYESMLGAISDPTSLEAAVAKRAHKRLAEIAAEVKLSNSGVVELANQVRHHLSHVLVKALAGLPQNTYRTETFHECIVSVHRT